MEYEVQIYKAVQAELVHGGYLAIPYANCLAKAIAAGIKAALGNPPVVQPPTTFPVPLPDPRKPRTLDEVRGLMATTNPPTAMASATHEPSDRHGQFKPLHPQVDCTWSDGCQENAVVIRYSKYGYEWIGACEKCLRDQLRAEILGDASFPCCGGSDENPPEHCQDCVGVIQGKREAFEEAARMVDHKLVAKHIRALAAKLGGNNG